MNEIEDMNEIEHEAAVLSSAEQIDLQAVRWFMDRSESREGTRDQDAGFEAWLAQSPKHLLAYWRIEVGYEHVQRLATIRSPSDLRDGASIRPIAKDRTRDWSFWFKRISATAAVLAVGIIAVFAFTGRQMVTYSTPTGGHEILTLADGSRVELNTDTVVRVANTTDRERAVELVRGEAFFEVKHDPAHPLVVNVGGDRLVDLGTEFVVRKEADRTRIGVVEGRVRLESIGLFVNTRLATLTPGDLVVATANNIAIAKSAARQLTYDLAWRTGRLILRHTSLKEAAAEFNRYNAQKLIVADAQTADLTVSGTFPVGGTEIFARLMQKLMGLHVEHRDGEIVISR
jgi:transmembrane sensor